MYMYVSVHVLVSYHVCVYMYMYVHAILVITYKCCVSMTVITVNHHSYL